MISAGVGKNTLVSECTGLPSGIFSTRNRQFSADAPNVPLELTEAEAASVAVVVLVEAVEEGPGDSREERKASIKASTRREGGSVSEMELDSRAVEGVGLTILDE